MAGSPKPARSTILYLFLAPPVYQVDALVQVEARSSGMPGAAFSHRITASNSPTSFAAAGLDRLVHVSAIGANPESESKYACTKAAGEMAVREARPDAVIIRPSFVFGAGGPVGLFADSAGMSRGARSG